QTKGLQPPAATKLTLEKLTMGGLGGAVLTLPQQHRFPMRRRQFLAGAAGAAVTVGSRSRAAEGAVDEAPFDRAMRWGQLAFVENDPGRYDRDFWLDYFRRTHLDAVTLSAGGVVAFYPTKIPFHHRSAWMAEGTDPFGDLADACRRLGMLVLARVDPHAVYPDAGAAHP